MIATTVRHDMHAQPSLQFHD